jgi:dynein heavy chain
VSSEQDEAAAIQAAMAGEEAEAAGAAQHTLCLKEEAQAELDLVLPALAQAEAALNALNKNDIVEIRTFSKPPALVQLTLEGVCVLLQVRGCGCGPARSARRPG